MPRTIKRIEDVLMKIKELQLPGKQKAILIRQEETTAHVKSATGHVKENKVYYFGLSDLHQLRGRVGRSNK